MEYCVGPLLINYKLEKKHLANTISEVFVPIGFKRNGNCWIMKSNEIIKIINLKKSQFSNNFYINYGYIIIDLPLGNNVMHVFNSLGAIDKKENERIKEILDLENNMCDKIRANELKKVLLEIIVLKFNSIDTKFDLWVELKKLPNLNNIPLVVKNYFNLLD